jgi:uncharacterized repeat protein (TIGR02543 family)
MENQAITEGGTASLHTNTFYRNGYLFLGWAASDSAAAPEYADAADFTIGTEDVTLYAVWDEEIVATINVVGGSFSMGDDSDSDTDNPEHSVTLSTFCIGRYEVTQEQYETVMGSNPASDYGVGDDYPVYYVTWYNAVAFCNALSELEGLEQVYTIDGTDVTADFTRNGYRLPTEAEWEYAARGGQDSEGYTYSGSNTIEDVAWYSGNSESTTHTVGTKTANELELYDLSGNVWEWCWDRYDSDYYDGSPSADPTGPSSGAYHVVRGGGWSSRTTSCCSAARGDDNPSGSSYNLGFRVARFP